MATPTICTPASATAGRSPTLSIALMAVAAFTLVSTEFSTLGLLPSLARELHISISAAGQLVSLYALTVTVCGPFLTAWLSHVNRKKLFIAITIVFAISNAFSALADSFWLLAFARFISAAVLPVFWGTASESAGQLVGPQKAGKAVATVYIGITAGFVFGIPLSTFTANHFGWRGSFWGLAALSLAVALLMAVLMPALPASPRREAGTRQTAILKDGRFLLHVVLSTLVFTAMFTAYTYLAETLERVVGIPSQQLGWWLMGFGAVGMVGNYIGGHLADRSAIGATIVLLFALAIAMAVVVPTVSIRPALVTALAVWGICFTALFPVSQVRVMQAGKSAQALAGTMNISAANGGIALGAAIGGLVVQTLGLTSLEYVASALAVLSLALGVVLLKMRAS
ncbi:MFS transporter [Paraburkholderia flagellata]|uniref:MFS transporter n=1 Tax=Paraburkholderia flagellata TaxID=2883241 RepID=UPI001F38F9E7|nr:MFS transporter [Paraburkholderia flagellata]